MNLIAFRVQMYKCILDSGWIEVSPLTALVGKNEAGKTSLLKALHKFNPFRPEPYSLDREWPRGHRANRNENSVVCSARFSLTDTEIQELSYITDQEMSMKAVEVTKDYSGKFEILFPNELFPNRLHPNDIDKICASLPTWSESIGEAFREQAQKCLEEVRQLAREGRYTDLVSRRNEHSQMLNQSLTPGQPHPQYQYEQQFINSYIAKIQEISSQMASEPSIHGKAHEYVITHLPIFIYMDEYRVFQGSAYLDQVKQREEQRRLTEEDKTLLTILELSGLSLESEYKKGQQSDREQRQYDLDDAAATLTREIEGRWKQRKYEIKFNADGNQFFTFVKDQKDRALIKLEERSKGFQWFFSFDLMFMYESEGDFRDCVILLDEPGLHLHPDGQKDLLRRLEEYAKDNTLLYTTHLPFMIDLRNPERIRILSETPNGTVVTDDLAQSQTEAKFTLQAALGMSGSQSYLLSQRNLVVEGVDDYWVLTELSNLLIRSGRDGIPDDVFITAAGGASEAAYIATFMIGQKLEVVVLLDSDKAGDEAHDSLVKKWLTRYNSISAQVLNLGSVVGILNKEFSIEDMFPDDFYMQRVEQVYKKELSIAGVDKIEIEGSDQLCKRVERALAKVNIKFNKGSVAKVIRMELNQMHNIAHLPQHTQDKAIMVMKAITEAFPRK